MCSYVCICLFDFVLFFFFKQKTAYEMRISDWSSDVCSSDLRTLSAGFNCWYAGPVGDSPVGGPGCRVRLPQKQEAKMSDHALESSPSPGRDQIGRASCRERVCQYV